MLLTVASLALQAAVAPRPTPPPLVHGYVYFAAGSSDPIRRTTYDPITYLGERIPADAFVYVRGQTDTLGSAAANDALARQRAYAVADLLVEQGVAPSKIIILACGERVLNRATADETAESLNRFVFFDWGPEPASNPMGCPSEPYTR